MSLRNSLDETNSNKHAKALSDDESNIKKRKSFDPFLTRKKSAPKKSAPSSPHKKSHSSHLDSIKDDEDKEFRSPEEERKYLADLQAQFNAAREEILAIKKERYPLAVANFIKFLRTFHSAKASHQGDLLNDPTTVEKVTDEMIFKFFKKHRNTFRPDLAEVFVTEGVKESDLQHFDIILLHTNVQKRLQAQNKDIQLTALNIQTLCAEIRNNPQYANKPLPKLQEKQPEKQQRDKMRISAVLKHHSRKNSLESESSSQPEQPLNVSSLNAPIEAIIEEPEFPIITPRKTTNKSSSSSVQTPRSIFIFSPATKRNDEKIDVVLKNVEEHLAKLDQQAKEDLSKKDVYYAVNNLYNRCRTRIIELQSDKNRIFNDPKHKLISESNEVKLLQRVDDLLTTVYHTRFDYASSPDKLKDHINEKREALEKYKKVCNQRTLGATLGKVALAVAIAVGVTLACAALGTFIGALAFAWSGPGAFLAAIKGGLLGGNIGWTVGLLAASSATGISTSVIVSKFWLFKDSKLQKGVDKVAEQIDNVITREEMLKTAP